MMEECPVCCGGCASSSQVEEYKFKSPKSQVFSLVKLFCNG